MNHNFFLILLIFSLFYSVADATKKKELGIVRKTIRGFSAIDTNYIEPQHYNFTVMGQMTYNYDIFKLKGSSGQSVTFSPDAVLKVGPYVGWRWFFLGWTFDIKNLNIFNGSNKKELDFSIYSSQIGLDLFYRRTGSDYKIRETSLGLGDSESKLHNIPFDGINVGTTGFNIYYIFNHKRFSYPAAFAQSTCQKISCGSWMAGFGFTNHSLDFEHDKFLDIVNQHIPTEELKVDSSLMFNSVKYYDISLLGGYAYNWVFAKNWLFCASGAVALAYKNSNGKVEGSHDDNFNFSKIYLDGVGRFGIVYNNTRWYAGASAIVRSYHYEKDRFQTNNIFGTLNVYIGYNFGLKKGYRKQQ